MITSLTLQDPTLLKSQGYINGQWLDADSGATIQVCNPATGVLVGTVPHMGAAAAQQAITAAQQAFECWKQRTADDRARVLRLSLIHI